MAATKNCEIFKAYSDCSTESSSSGDDSDFDELLSSSNSLSTISTLENRKAIKKQEKSIQRMPTRRPDPNVSNRNALLARENRRRKKAYVETLEKELHSMKYTNKKLHKLLRKQLKIVKKLEHEKQYYKKLVSSGSDIINLVSVLGTKEIPSLSNFASKKEISSSTTVSTSSSETFNYDFNDDGSELLLADPFLTDCFIDDFNFFTDSSYELYSETNWDKLPGVDDIPFPDEIKSCYTTNSNRCEVQNISGEHNYFSAQSEEEKDLYFQIAHEKMPEYCSSARQLCQLPEQLLVVD